MLCTLGGVFAASPWAVPRDFWLQLVGPARPCALVTDCCWWRLWWLHWRGASVPGGRRYAIERRRGRWQMVVAG